MPVVGEPITFMHRGEPVLVALDFDARIPLRQARILFAGVAGTIRRAQDRGASIEWMIDDVVGAAGDYRHVARVVSRSATSVEFAIAKP